jgi:hypothetical protein
LAQSFVVRIYLAEGSNRTLVSRRPPAVSGPVDHLELGNVTIVRPRESEEQVRFAIPRTAGWRLLGRSRADYRMIDVLADRNALGRAADATIVTLGHWPALRSHVALADPSPTLAQALWDLAGVLVERSRVRASLGKLSSAGRGVPRDSPIHGQVAARIARARERMSRLDGEISARVRHLTRLADETELFVGRQKAIDAAQAVLRDADYLLETGDPGRLSRSDGGADLAEHTSAVLAAYRELTS